MSSKDTILTNKQFLKKFLKAQEYFNKLDQDDINQVVEDVIDELNVNFYSGNTFLFHYDSEEYYDWYIILKGKVSFYYPKSEQEIAQEINLFRQRSIINSEIDKLQRQLKSTDYNQLFDKLQNQKLQVEQSVCEISSSQYDYIFQKYHSSYYQHHPQVLSFKQAGIAGVGYVFDQSNSEKPYSVHIDEDSFIGVIKNEQYVKIFQKSQTNQQIRSKDLKNIQVKQDNIYYMFQVQEQYNNSSPQQYELANIFQDKHLSPSQQQIQQEKVDFCDTFKQFVDNIPEQMTIQQQQTDSLSLATESLQQSPSRDITNVETNFQKQVNNLIKHQTPQKQEGTNNYQVAQKQKEIFSNASNKVSPKQYPIKEKQNQENQLINSKMSYVTNQDQMRGNLKELINQQKQLLQKQSFLKQQQGNDKQKSLLNKQQESNQIETKDILTFQKVEEIKNPSKEFETVFQKQSIFNNQDGIQQESKKIPQTLEIQENNQQNITKSQNHGNIIKKQSNSCYQQEIYNSLVNKDMQKMNQINKGQNDVDQKQSYNLQIRSGSVGDAISQLRLIQKEKAKLKQQNTLVKQCNNQAILCDKKYDFFSLNNKNHVQNEKNNEKQQLQHKINKCDYVDMHLNKIGQIKSQSSKNQDIKNLYPQVFQKARILSQQLSSNHLNQGLKVNNRGSENENDYQENTNDKSSSKNKLNQINETFQNSQYQSNQTQKNINQDQLNNVYQQDLMSTFQSSQEGIIAKTQTEQNNTSSQIQQTTDGSSFQQSTIQSPFQQNTVNHSFQQVNGCSPFQQAAGSSLLQQTNNSSSSFQQKNQNSLHQQNTSTSASKIDNSQHQQNTGQQQSGYSIQNIIGSNLFQLIHGKNQSQQMKQGNNQQKLNTQNNTSNKVDVKQSTNVSMDRNIYFNNIMTNSSTKNQKQLNMTPNLIEKRKNYPNEFKNFQNLKESSAVKRIHSQPIVQSKSYNPSLTNSINNSPLSSAKNNQKRSIQNTSTSLISQPINQREQCSQTLAHFNLADSCNQTPVQTNRKSSNNSNHSLNDLQTEGSKKQIVNSQNSYHYSSITSTKNQIQRISSTIGFQTPQQQRQEYSNLRGQNSKYRVEHPKLKGERPRSSGFKGNKLYESAKYSFISAFPNNKSQKSMNTSQSQDFRKCFTINSSNYTNDEMSYQINESLRMSQNRESNSSVLQQSDILNQNSQQDEKRRQNSSGQLNLTNTIKSIDNEYNKQAQDQNIKNQTFNARLLAAKQSKEFNSIPSQQRTTQTQIQKDLMKSKAANKQIIKGSFAHKLTPEQSSFINSISKAKPLDNKQITNQQKQKSIREELLENLQRKIELKQNSFIKLQACNQQQNQSNGDQQNQQQIMQKQQQQNEIINSQDIKQKTSDQKNQQLDQMQKKYQTKEQDQEQNLKESEYEYDEEDSIQAQDDQILLKLMQERENDSPENYIGFSSEKVHNQNNDRFPSFGQKSKQSKTPPDIYKMSNASFGSSEKINQHQYEVKEDNSEQNFIQKQYNKIQNNMNKLKDNQANKYNSNTKQKQMPQKNHQFINYDFDYLELPEQVTLGQVSNKGKNIFNLQHEHFHSDQKFNSHPVHISSQSQFSDDFNTQTFQKRNSLPNTIQGKQVTIQETPKFTFQIL